MSNIVYLQGFGGGTSLRFKVISCPSKAALPVKPKENTIAVISTLYSGEYELSTTSPNIRTQGKVWVQLAASSAYGFSVTRKNPVWVYPVKCHIYDSSWKGVESYIYQGGSWQTFGTVYLYNSGDERISFTGGWTSGAPPYSGEAGFSGGVTKYDTYIGVRMDPDLIGTDANIGQTLRCSNTIDLTPYKTLTFQGSFTKYTSNSNAWYACWNPLGDTYQKNVAAVKKFTASNSADVVLDVSSLEGEHTIGIGVRACGLRLDKCFLST